MIFCSEDRTFIDYIYIQKLQHDAFIYQSESNIKMAGALQTNHNIKWVLTPDIGFYLCMYASKVAATNNKSIDEAISSLRRYLNLLNKQELEKPSICPKSDHSKGMSMFNKAVYSLLKSTSIGSELAFWCLLKKTRFIYSHDFAVVNIWHFSDWLTKDVVPYRINKEGYINEMITQYPNRHPMLEEICVYYYFCKYETKPFSYFTSKSKKDKVKKELRELGGMDSTQCFFNFL